MKLMTRNRRSKVDLPEELIGEILLKLSVKDLLRFKSVCKEWCALIGSRRFIVGHYEHESNPDGQLIHSRSHSVSICGDDGRLLRSLSHYTQMQRCDYLLGPTNGVFCAVRHHLRYRVVLLNPATRKLKLLPRIPLQITSYFKLGFGIDDRDFKVVVLSQRMHRNFICVYNSSSDSWSKTRVVGWLKDRVLLMMDRNCVFSNGVCYWLMRDKSILGFDMRSEKFHEILPPDAIIRDNLYVDYMSAYGDSIALVSRKSGFLNIWVMGRDGLWGKRVSIHLPQLIYYINSIFAWNKNELLLDTSTQTETDNNTLFLCDISTQKLRKFRPDFEGSDCYKVYSYKESLFSFKGETDDNGEWLDQY